jgi:hypothetical protein
MATGKPTAGPLLLGLLLLAAPCRADDKVAANARGRLEAASKVYRGMLERLRDANGQVAVEDLYQWSRRWLEAERDLADTPEAAVAAAQAHLDRMTKLEAVVRKAQTVGLVPAYEVPAAEFYRLEAERALAQARKK